MSEEGAAPTTRGGPQRIPRPPGTRQGSPAPWAHLPAEERRLDVATVRSRLAASGPPARSPHEASADEPPAAPGSAVLVALYDLDGEAHVILTRRAWHLRSHRGEVSFPGGRLHTGEHPHEGALREAWEEVRLPPTDVEVIGELDHRTTVSSRSFIVPVVGILHEPPGALEAQPDEVAQILHVPLSELLEPAHFREEHWNLPPLRRPVYFFELVGDTVWGATAAMLVDLLTRLTGTHATPGL